MAHASSKQIYRPLSKDRKETRIIHLHGPQSDGLLHASLQHVFLDVENERPRYEAISYCCGEVEGEEDIMLDGMKCRVPASAVKVLHRFQPQGNKESRVLWIDAVCIDQANITERGQQVRMMSDIYRQCERCLIWLGGYDESVDMAMNSMKLIFSDMVQRTSKYHSALEAREAGAFNIDTENDFSYSQALFDAGLRQKAMEALDLFFDRSWFGRLWVLQEACLAPDAVCWCGHLGIGWRQVYSAIHWLLGKHGALLLQSGLSTGKFSMITFSWYFKEVQARLPVGDQLRRLIRTTNTLDCSEPLDRVFAILGLTDWTTHPHRWPKNFIVDYEQPYTRVLAFMNRAAMAREGDFHHFMWAGISRNRPEDDTRQPSWIPN